MGNKSYSWRFGLLLAGFLAVGIFGFVQALRSPMPVSSMFAHVSMYVLLAFLLILFLRSFLLMWFSYLDHLEVLMRGEDA